MFERVLYLISAILIRTIVENDGHNLEQSRYDTAYACEGSTLQLRCKENQVINLIRANYGRFSVTVCNDDGHTEWSVNCMASKSLRILYARCSDRQSCSVQASTSLFNDPCPGTFKYLEAHFKCVPADTSTTTSRPSPPWLLTSQPNVWSTAKISTVRPPVLTGLPPRTDRVTKPPAKIVTTTPLTTTESNFEIATDNEFDAVDEVSKVTTPVVVSIPNRFDVWNEDEMCAPEYARGLKWNWTKSGNFSVQPCPGGAAGVAKWRCLDGKPPKRPLSPDLSECRSLWLAGLDLRITEGDAVTSIADDLSQVTDSKPLFGGDLMTTTLIIKKLAHKMSLNIQTYPDQRQREAIVSELLRGVVKTSSNLLDASQLASWRDLPLAEQMKVASSLLLGIEENSFLLADTVVREKTVIHTERNILLHVRILESNHIDRELFACGNNDDSVTIDNNWSGSDNWLRLEKKALIENQSGGNLLRIVYSAFDRLEEILIPYSRDNVTRIVNSKIISASLGKGRHIQLSEPVTLCLKHIAVENVSNPSCVYWDYTSPAWSEEGCRVEATNKTHTICVCDHLTNFALLMESNDSDYLKGSLMFYQIVIYIGCVVSIIGLSLSITTFVFFRSLKSDRTTIHTNLCICLLAAELLFVFGINQSRYSVLCGIVAGLLHYFFLCSFVWLFFEGFQLYITFLEVFNVDKSRILWYYLFSYGFPLIVVIISSIVDPYSYGTDRYCWLKADNFFIFIFVGPIVGVILANIVFLSMAIYTMCRHTSNPIKSDDCRLATAMIWLRGAIILVFILGLTWTFGLLFLNEESPVVAYIFACLNASQGLFIFFFHCVQNEKVQKEYLKILSRWFDRIGFKEEETTAVEENKERRSSLYGIQNKLQTESTSGTIVINNQQINWSPNEPDNDESHCRTTPRPSNLSGVNLPKSSTSWGNLNRPFVWKNSNFDEETIKSAAVLSDTLRKSNYSCYASQYPQQLTAANSNRQRKRSRNGSLRPTSPWNHTYTEISERERERQERREDDPVYEEIERERHFVAPDSVRVLSEYPEGVRNSSDLSDDEFRRVSDMSRQSSRSYGDHRPLIPYSPGTDRNFHSALDAAFRQRLKEQASKAAQQQQSTIAVLDGQTVVCHLQPEYDTRSPATNHHQPYTEC